MCEEHPPSGPALAAARQTLQRASWPSRCCCLHPSTLEVMLPTHILAFFACLMYPFKKEWIQEKRWWSSCSHLSFQQSISESCCGQLATRARVTYWSTQQMPAAYGDRLCFWQGTNASTRVLLTACGFTSRSILRLSAASAGWYQGLAEQGSAG